MQKSAGLEAFFEISPAGQNQNFDQLGVSAPPVPKQKPLTVLLRDAVAPIHQTLENDAGLPAKIVDLADYKSCLARFFSVVAPLERELAAISGWASAGIDLPQRARTPALAADLAKLGIDPAALAVCRVPAFTDFPSAFGGLYVLEGSTLGGKFILRALEQRLGPAMLGATTFFTGHGKDAGPRWQEFKAALDEFGSRHGLLQGRVIDGAVQTFKLFAIGLQE